MCVRGVHLKLSDMLGLNILYFIYFFSNLYCPLALNVGRSTFGSYSAVASPRPPQLEGPIFAFLSILFLSFLILLKSSWLESLDSVALKAAVLSFFSTQLLVFQLHIHAYISHSQY